MAILCGTCAWADHRPFYPKTLKPDDRLAYYAEFFPLVEVDSSFYGIPKPATVQAWSQNVPSDFVFNMKAYRTLTLHDRGNSSQAELARDAALFESAVAVLAARNQLGVILFQFPPWFVVNQQHIAHVENIHKRFAEYPIAIEFRHRSWWKNEQAQKSTLSFLAELGAVNVVCDEPQAGMGTIPFVPDVTNSNLVVFRLHGRNEKMWYQTGLTSSQDRFDYLYQRSELEEFLPMIRRWESESRNIHILMNNNQGNDAVVNALDWLELLGLERRPRPVLMQSKQLSLFDDHQC